MLQQRSLGERIALIRKIKNITQKDVASALNFSDRTISSWENNSSEPGLNEIKQIAKYFGISLNFLLEGIANGEQDALLLATIESRQAIEKNRAEVYSFVCGIEKLDKDSIEVMFDITENKVLCNLETLIQHGNFELFKAINEKYDFYVQKDCENNWFGCDKPVKQKEVKQHPINLEFSDIFGTGNIAFYKYALKLLDKKIAQEKGKNNFSYGNNRTNKTEILCSALDHIKFDFSNETNEIILFLLDNGAYIRTYIPYLSGDGYTVERNELMTSFVRATILKYKDYEKK